MTILAIAQTCAKRLMLTVPSTFIGSTSNNMILLKAMIDLTIDEIRDEYPWPELEKEYTFTLSTSVESYALPGDYDRKQNETLWNRDQNWPLIGPMDAVLWQQYKSGLITSLPRQRFRIKGWGLTQFFIDPTPSTDENGQTIAYEYISKTARRPKTWTSGTVWTGLRYCSYNGYIFDRGTEGAATTGTDNAPTPADLTDGLITWTLLSTAYESFTYDSDEVILDNEIITQGAIWRFKRERKLGHLELQESAEKEFDKAKTKLSGATVIDFKRGGQKAPYMINESNYPDGSY